MIKKFFITLFVLAVLCCATVAGVIYYLVVVDPGPEIASDNIHKILGRESHVFYNDGKTKLGVFFDHNHRQYVEYAQIPTDFINALVAAEDNLFFSHFGFDPVSIARAAVKNFQAGRVIQGGSTLTQQTAKNLFKRTDRSYKAKLKELLFALRLEYWYSKEQIFEFYANQFYVSGNGHGLGVAARYYFDKKVQDLTLKECAYIAGSVKKPNAYNPFIKKTKEATESALAQGRTRTNYVLKRMYELEMLGFGGYREQLNKELKFKQGSVGFSLDYAMELVKRAVEQPEVLEALEQNGISNVSTSGINIITSVDKNLQDFTLQKLRSELSRLDIRLRGYDRKEVQTRLLGLQYKGDRKVVPGAFVFGRVLSIENDPKDPVITVDLGRKNGIGKIDREGLTQAWTAFAKWKKNAWSTPDDEDLKELLSQIRVSDKVWVSITQVDGAEVSLKLEKYPLVQGGAVVLHHGAINAVVGGTENRFFDRAIDAKRTMGSSFKPFLFAAAIQLGWNPADVLINKRDIFVFQGQAYFPRPDHKIKHQKVSMSWAGVHSENVASIWLTAHLCDRLSADQFREVAEQLGLAPRVVDGLPEPYSSYSARIRDRYGVLVNREMIAKAAFQQAVKNVETDFIFEGMSEQYQQLTSLRYGLGFERFAKAVEQELTGDEKLTRSRKNELKLRQKLLQNNYLALVDRMAELNQYKQRLFSPFDYAEDVFEFDLDGNTEKARLYFDPVSSKYRFVTPKLVNADLQPLNKKRLQTYLGQMSREEQDEFWNQVVLDSTISVAAFNMLAAQVDRESRKFKEVLPYDFDVLAKINDFRILVGLHYLISFAKEMGFTGKMEPVLSFPLGSNVVSLYETTRMYEGLSTGKINYFGQNTDSVNDASLAIIDRIESAEGRVLYSAGKKVRSVTDERTALQVGHILENTVKFGTGRYADRNVKVQPLGEGYGDEVEDMEVKMPLLGKTGTANRYTNASFFGFLPSVNDNNDGVDLKDGYAVGVYVGYDDNDPMRKGTTKITGAAGALPTWTAIVNKLIEEHDFGSKLDPVDVSFTGLPLIRDVQGTRNLKADVDEGGTLVLPVVDVSDSARYTPSIMTFLQKNSDGLKAVKERRFEPFWRVREPVSVNE